MLPRLAQAIESLFGERVEPVAGFIRAAATVTLGLAIVLPLLRAVLSFTAFKYGWENALVVRCPRCRRLVADPDLRICPSGHPIRFPSGAAAREARRRRFHRLGRIAASYRFGLPVSVALAALAGFLACGVSRVEGPLATIAASAGYLFFAAALALASLGASPKPRGVTERTILVGTAAACLLPAMALSLLGRAFEPPRPRVIGHVWSTPTALYVSSGGRGRRLGDPRMEIEALFVEARAPAFGIVWQGLEGFRSRERVIQWTGRGGFTARLLSRWASPLSRRGILLSRSTRTVALPPNVKVWIVSGPSGIRFTTGSGYDLVSDLTDRPDQPERTAPAPLPRRSG